MDDVKKKICQQVLGRVTRELSISLYAWVILNNHYHLMCDFGEEGASELTFATPNGKKMVRSDEREFVTDRRNTRMARFIRKFHSVTAMEFNRIDVAEGRKIWYQYWDYCIRNRPDFWRHFNYIAQNPLKHGLVRTLDAAYCYPHSSNPIWLKRFGVDGLSESFEKYPVRDWTPSDGECAE